MLRPMTSRSHAHVQAAAPVSTAVPRRGLQAEPDEADQSPMRAFDVRTIRLHHTGDRGSLSNRDGGSSTHHEGGRVPIDSSMASVLRRKTGSVLEAVSSPGSPLDQASRSLMERRFGRDFSGVRVHTGATAAGSARDIEAAAYTIGSHIVFGAGRYDPQTHAGRRLLAHELGHVVQQRGNAAHAAPRLGSAETALEAEADHAARRVAFGLPATSSMMSAPAGLVQCSPLSEAVKKDLGADPTVSAVLTRLGAADVRAVKTDADLDAEIERLLKNNPDDIWVAQRVWHGLREGELDIAPRPIQAFFFAGATARRALVIAGVHGNERQGIEVAGMLIELLKKQQPKLTTIVVPSLFPDNEAARSREGGTKTNRNFPSPKMDLAAARKAGSKDEQNRQILPENLLLMELMERFRPERIISIHGTWDPNKAGVFYDPRALNAQEEVMAAMAGSLAPMAGPLMRTAMLQEASDTDKRLSLDAAKQIDKATAGIKGREDRVRGKGRKAHPSVAGNVGKSGDLDFAFWGGDVEKGVSLGGYASARGMSIFTVEPPINRNVADYEKGKKGFGPAEKLQDKVGHVDRKTELMAYAEAVRTVLLGQ